MYIVITILIIKHAADEIGKIDLNEYSHYNTNYKTCCRWNRKKSSEAYNQYIASITLFDIDYHSNDTEVLEKTSIIN